MACFLGRHLTLVFISMSCTTVATLPQPYAFWRLNAIDGLKDTGNASQKLNGVWMSQSRPSYFTQGPDYSNNGAVILGPNPDDYVSFNYSQLQFDGSKSFTISLFFKSLGNTGPILEYTNTTPNAYGWRLWANFPTIDKLYLGEISSFPCQHSIGWQFMAVVYHAGDKTVSLFCQDQWISVVKIGTFPNVFSPTMNLGKRIGQPVPLFHVSCLSLYMDALDIQDLCDVKWYICMRNRTSRSVVSDNCRSSLIGFWPLTSWAQLDEQGGRHLNGAFANSSNAPTFVRGPDGGNSSAVEMGPGFNDYVYFNHSALANSTYMTVAFFFYANGITKRSPMLEYVFEDPTSGAASPGFHLWANEGTTDIIYVNPKYYGTYSVNTTCQFSAGWQFILLLFNKTAQTIAVSCNNQWIKPIATNETGIETSSGYFTLGKRANYTVYQQRFACLSIFSDILHWNQYCDLRWRSCLKTNWLNATDGCIVSLIGYWPLTSNSGIADLSGFGFDALFPTLTVKPNYTFGPDGRTSYAMQLGPSDDNYITISSKQWYAFDNKSSWTFMLFFKAIDPSGGPILAYTNNGFSIWANRSLNGDKLWISTGDGGAGMAFDCSFKCWQFVAVSYDAKNGKIVAYCDSSQAGTMVLPENVYPQMDSGTFNIGKLDGESIKRAAASCLMLIRGPDQPIFTYYKPICLGGPVYDSDCPITTTTTTASTTSVLVSSTVTTASTTTTMAKTTPTTAPITTAMTTTELPRVTFSPPNSEPSNLVTNPVEALNEFYPPNVNGESSMPLLTAEKLLQYCSDFSSNRIAPPNNDQPTAILAAFAVNRLVDFSDVEETITLDVLFFLRWQVTTCPKGYLLQWLPISESKGLERLFVPNVDTIWLPKYFFETSAEDIYMKGRSYGDDFLATAASNLNDATTPNQTLTFYHLRRGFFKSKCPLNLRNFPFDSVTCRFAFALERSIDQVTFSQQYILCPANVESTEWHFLGCDVMPTSWMRLDASNVSVATFTTTFRRNPSYYVVNLALPNFAFGLLELASYLIPADRPERPIFAVATQLSLAVGQTTLTREIPHSSERSILGDYMTALIWFCGLITVYHLFASFHSDGKHSSIKIHSARRVDSISFAIASIVFIALHAYVGVFISRY